MKESDLIHEYFLNKDNEVFYSVHKKNQKELDKETFEVAKYFNKDYTEEWVIKTLGRKWKRSISILMSFIDLYQYISERNDYVQCFPISCLSDVLLDIFGAQTNVSYVIAMAKKVELLYCVRNDYQFNAWNEEDNKAKCYILNKDIQDIIKSISINNNITYTKYTKHNNINKSYNIINSNNIRSSRLFEQVRINSGLGVLRITDDIGHKNKEEYVKTIESILDYKYPQIAVMQEEANWVNEQSFYQEHPELQIRCEPKVTFTKSGCISKISLRATNRIVSLKEHNITDKDIRTRKKYLNELFGENYQSYDVKASIYQLTYALNTNDWLDNKVDMYREIYGKDFEDKALRDELKALCMPMYFDKSFEKVLHHLSKKMNKDKSELMMPIVNIYNRFVNAVGGKTYDSEIFLHESVIYNHVTFELVKQGWNVVQIYDGWYANHSNKNLNLKDNIDSILTSYITYYLNTYISNNNNSK